ncbi:hypothetical protein [Chitinimonas sp.]|uniref:hypothetical protein n=1 Tax=Chitinimonas sp. TaxID=1934313 RepID=UPI0035B4460D
MKKLHRLFPIWIRWIAVCWLPLPGLASPTAHDVAVSISNAFPGESIIEKTSGILDDGEEPYIAVLLAKTSNEARIAVTHQNGSGKFTITGKSLPLTELGRSILRIKISNKSLYLSVFNSGGCCSRSTTNYQFKKISGELWLIGTEAVYESIEMQTQSDINQGIIHHFRTKKSINFITNRVIHSRKSWDTDPTNSQKIGKTKHTELELHIKKQVHLKLDTFSLVEYENATWDESSLCGTLDEHMKYRAFDPGVCKPTQ